VATLEWVAWFNHQRLHSAIGYIPPAEAEANYYNRLNSTEQQAVLLYPNSFLKTRGDSCGWRWMAVCWQSCGRAAVDRRR